MADEVVAPELGFSLVVETPFGIGSTEYFQTWMAQVSDAITNLQPILGEGSPEGVVTASPVRLYIDTLTNNLYAKIIGDGATGWQLTS